MKELVTQIQIILADYHCDSGTGFSMTEKHIEEWVNQFQEDDREFLLSELLHILNNGVYITKEEAKVLLIENLTNLAKRLKYNSLKELLKESVFINTQKEGKSQDVLLNLINPELQNITGLSINQCGSFVQKNYIFIDDILASNKTILTQTKAWMEKDDNLKKFIANEFNFCIVLLCQHTWGADRMTWSLKQYFKNDNFTNPRKFIIESSYKIFDNKKTFNSPLNLTLPLKSNPNWNVYLANIDNATQYEDRAYREINQPKKEDYFSTPENRNRFEGILLNKGIEIIGKFQDESKKRNHRPLGKSNPSYKTFGTGTLFFTWRNISNTCPIVFWWDNPAHNWKGLFPLLNRGL